MGTRPEMEGLSLMTVKDLKRAIKGLSGDAHICIAQISNCTSCNSRTETRYEIRCVWKDGDGVVNVATGQCSKMVNHAKGEE